ncbi:MAG: universal stress protein [Rhodobacteraceae bacterium]|nr:universal stress protein [Paracoccaceae bacterium]
MAYKSILTVATDTAVLSHTIANAADLAQAQNAHLDVLSLGVDDTQMGYAYLGSGAVFVADTLDRAQAEATRIDEAARKAAAVQSPALRWGSEAVVTQLGMLTDVVAQRARFADLVILAQPYGPGRSLLAEAVLEAALFEGRAPVLVLPDGVAFNPAPSRVVIAWNNSVESLAAVRQALPLLQAASAVTIVVVDPPVFGPERSDPGGALCQMLVRHGVHADVTVLAKSLPRVSDVLMRHARDNGADLLVMGAYGHSRFREAILGGATRNTLEEANIPVLLAH